MSVLCLAPYREFRAARHKRVKEEGGEGKRKGTRRGGKGGFFQPLLHMSQWIQPLQNGLDFLWKSQHRSVTGHKGGFLLYFRTRT